MLADHRDVLFNSSFRLILDSSVGLSSGIQSAGDSVPETLGSNPAFSRGRQTTCLLSSRKSLACACASASKLTTTNMYESSTVYSPGGSTILPEPSGESEMWCFGTVWFAIYKPRGVNIEFAGCYLNTICPSVGLQYNWLLSVGLSQKYCDKTVWYPTCVTGNCLNTGFFSICLGVVCVC